MAFHRLFTAAPVSYTHLDVYKRQVYEADYKRFEVVVTKADERKALEINMTVEELSDEE